MFFLGSSSFFIFYALVQICIKIHFQWIKYNGSANRQNFNFKKSEKCRSSHCTALNIFQDSSNKPFWIQYLILYFIWKTSLQQCTVSYWYWLQQFPCLTFSATPVTEVFFSNWFFLYFLLTIWTYYFRSQWSRYNMCSRSICPTSTSFLAGNHANDYSMSYMFWSERKCS